MHIIICNTVLCACSLLLQYSIYLLYKQLSRNKHNTHDTRCYKQLRVPANEHFCFTFLEDSESVQDKGTFVPLGSRQSIGLNSATPETCDKGGWYVTLNTLKPQQPRTAIGLVNWYTLSVLQIYQNFLKHQCARVINNILSRILFCLTLTNKVWKFIISSQTFAGL